MELYLIIIFLDALEDNMLACTVPCQDQAFFFSPAYAYA